jgi:hypothetical protein
VRSPTQAIRLALIEDSPEYALLVRHLLTGELGETITVAHCGSIEEASRRWSRMTSTASSWTSRCLTQAASRA